LIVEITVFNIKTNIAIITFVIFYFSF